MSTHNKNRTTSVIAPLLSWDVYAASILTKPIKNAKIKDLLFLQSLKMHFQWTSGFDLQKRNYDAIVLTDTKETIIWVNQGFKKMTGYAPNYAIGKKPSFLQGEDTSKQTLNEIRKNIAIKRPFKSQLLNYKIDGAPYLCEIEVFPLKNAKDEVTHLLAFEKEI